jgi:hypothetical protein
LMDLRKHLLSFLPDPPKSKISYTEHEFDLTRSYIVLAHAEIESFCEELALQKIKRAKQVFDATGKITPVLRKVISYNTAKNRRSWSEVLLPSLTTIDSAIQSYSDTVRDNHGVKRNNLERLFYPLGILETKLNATWLAQMDSFASIRGGWAHKSIGAMTPPDPLTELNTVDQLLQGLLNFDRAVSRLQ